MTTMLPHRSMPILLYHRISDKSERGPLPRDMVTLDQFQRQMQWLHKGGFTTGTLCELAQYVQAGVFKYKTVFYNL